MIRENGGLVELDNKTQFNAFLKEKFKSKDELWESIRKNIHLRKPFPQLPITRGERKLSAVWGPQ